MRPPRDLCRARREPNQSPPELDRATMGWDHFLGEAHQIVFREICNVGIAEHALYKAPTAKGAIQTETTVLDFFLRPHRVP